MSKKAPGKIIVVNKKARHDYTVEQTLEAGLVLEGWEVKSLRAGRAQLVDSYVIIKHGEAWLIGSHITPLVSASSHIKPESDRSRKLLLHKQELSRLGGLIQRQGYTLVALSLYWQKGRVKAEIGLVKGKKAHDKRESEKKRDWEREKSRLMRNRG